MAVSKNSYAKRFRRNITENNQQPPSISNVLQITDLPTDCLEEIFSKLELHDLLIAVDTSKLFNKIACDVFKGKFGNNPVFIEMHRLKLFSDKLNRTTIGSVNDGLRFLRCFGHLIHTLEFDANECNKKCCTAILRYVNEFCSDYLTELTVWTYRLNIFSEISKPFENVKKLALFYCGLETDQDYFKLWFPQMQCLDLDANKIVKSQCIVGNFSELEEFSYKPNHSISDNPEKQHLEQFVHLNRQLKAITLIEYIDATFIQYMSENLTGLKKLTINVNLYQIIATDFDISHTNFKNVNKFQLGLFDHPNIVIHKILPTFEQLEDFYAIGIDIDGLIEIFNKNPNISILKLVSYSKTLCLDERTLPLIADSLPLLSDLNVAGANLRGFTVDEIIRFMVEFKQLKNLKVMLNQEDDDLRTKLNDKWRIVHSVKRNKYQANMKNCFVTLERTID